MRVFLVVLAFCIAAVSQTASSPDSSNSLPKLDHFSPDMMDKSLDPCADFFQYACSKWIKANPIPADQAGWGTFNELAIWNTAAVRDTLEKAAGTANPAPTEKKLATITPPAWMRARSITRESRRCNRCWIV